MIEKPPSPHDLIGSNWPDIDELAVAHVAEALTKAGASSSVAERKANQDGAALKGVLQEGFDNQVDATLTVGGKASDLGGWMAKGAGAMGAAAESVAQTKMMISTETAVAEAMIDAREFEIAILEMADGYALEARAERIRQLRAEIKTITDDAKQANKDLYNGINVPVMPDSPNLQPLINNAPLGQKYTYGGVKPVDNTVTYGDKAGSPPAGLGEQGAKDSAKPSTSSSNQGEKSSSAGPKTQGEKSGSSPSGQSESGTSTQGSKAGSTPTGTASPASSGTVPSSPEPRAGGSVPSTSGVSQMSSAGSMLPKGGGVPSPSSAGGLGSSGMSGLGRGASAPSSASPASFNPSQQFLSGAAQGLSKPPIGTGAVPPQGSQPFKPAAGSTVQAAPVAPTPPAASAPATGAPQVQAAAAAQAPVAPAPAGTGGGMGGVPLAPPAPAGVPNAPTAATPPVAPNPAGGSSPVGPPPSAPPPGLMNMGAASAALKAAKMGSHSFGEGLRATPEFGAAMALVGALNDPEAPGGSLLPGGWSCAVFGSGLSQRFVIAERHGMSWIPAGVYLPAGVTVAHLDEQVPNDVRWSWRGMEPSALVLGEYAKAIGENPRFVVTRTWADAKRGYFAEKVVVVADEGSHVIIPNPLHNKAGRHRLQLLAPSRWQWIQSLPEDPDHLVEQIGAVAQWLVGEHNATFVGDPRTFDGRRMAEDAQLRVAAVSEIGRPGAAAMAKLVLGRMQELSVGLIGAPSVDEPQWVAHTNNEMMLRGFEALLLALGAAPTRATLADVSYAGLMATQRVLPERAEAVA